VVKPDVPIREALATLDNSALQIILLLDAKGRLVGTVTDGDVRRALLRGVDLGEPIERISNPNPVVIRPNTARDQILKVMRDKVLKRLPIVDHDGCVVGLEVLEDALARSEAENLVVLMAGGLGKRLRPLTDDVPKPMLQVGTKPILQTIIENFVDHGFRRFVLAVNYHSDQIKDFCNSGERWGADIQYVEEDQRLGTAGALGLLTDRPEQPFFVMNADILTRVNVEHMLDFHRQSGAIATMAIREFSMQVPYGVVQQDEARVLGIVEKPIHRVFVNAGIYVLEPEVLEHIDAGQALDMPVLLDRLIHDGQTVRSFPLHEYWLDIGRTDDLRRADEDFKTIFP
jgi:dTDP-glucose pyrophosphorylase